VRNRFHTPGAETGTTLVELLIVVSCAAVVLGGAVPGYVRISQEWRLRGGADLVFMSLHWGRSHAVAANTSLALQVSDDGQSVCWLDPGRNEIFRSSVRHLPPGVRIVSAPRRPVRFYPRGNAAPAGTYVIRGESGGYRVVVSPVGRIRTERE
jgi:type II secretory pathway pseudopilin PulG